MSLLTLRRKEFPKSKRVCHSKNIKPNRVVGAQYDMMVSTPRILFRRRPVAEGVPSIYCLILEMVHEVNYQIKAEILQQV